MTLKHHPGLEIPEALLEAIRAFPTRREIDHCGVRLSVSPFAFYADCPECGARIKVRSFSGVGEVEDVFDAVFEWMNQPTAEEVAKRRQADLKEEE